MKVEMTGDSPLKQDTRTRRDPYRLVGLTIAGKYRLDEYAGGGGMGAVYRAEALNSQELVAVKILKPDILERDPKNAELFEREVKAAQRLRHPHVVRVFDSGVTQDEISFMVMEWLDGQTLQEVVSQGQLPIPRVRNIFKQICEAFECAHKNNILHLDAKPANIFLLSDKQPRDFIKVIDFGMARVISNESGTTVTRFMGTLQYCSPEHFGGKVSSRSDVYSLGATLYYLLSGLIPFGASYIHAKQQPHLDLPPIPSLLGSRDIPKEVDQVIDKALSKDPADRQQSVKKLSHELDRAFGTLGTQENSEPTAQHIPQLLSTLLNDTVIDQPNPSGSPVEAFQKYPIKQQRTTNEMSRGSYASQTLFEYQLRIINAAVQATVLAASEPIDNRAGIAWQTTGTGLSSTITHYLSQVLQRFELRSYQFVVVTDRKEAAHQLWTLFSELFQHLGINATHISDLGQLEAALQSSRHKLIFTTTQRLQRLSPHLVTNDTTLLIGYDLHGYSERLVRLFPRAVSILFTSNPIKRQSPALTIFGTFIAKYTLEQAINDNLVFPVRIEHPDISPRASNDIFSAQNDGFSSVLESMDFFRSVAADIVRHFDSRDLGKALIVVPNRRVGEHLHYMILELYSHLYPTIEASKVVRLISSALNPEHRAMLTRRFKDPDDLFKLAITSGMWLTGLDTPLLKTIYLLKPMSQLSLLQVISRVARASEVAEAGVVVDYLGQTEMV